MARLPWETPELLRINLKTLASLRAGQKLSVLKEGEGHGEWGNLGDGGRGLRERFQASSSSLARYFKGESILNDRQYLEPLKKFFLEAGAAYLEEHVSAQELQAAVAGLKSLTKAYLDNEDTQRASKVDQIVRAVQNIVASAILDAQRQTGMRLSSLPSLEEWNRAVQRGPASPPVLRIGELLRVCHEQGGTGGALTTTFELFYVYGDLFLCAENWLKSSGQPMPAASREAEDLRMRGPLYTAIYRIFRTLVKQLEAAFGVTSMNLPKALVKHFGKKLDTDKKEHDRAALQSGTAIYLKRAQAAKYRVVFENGRALQYPWWRNKMTKKDIKQRISPSRGDMVLASSSQAVELEIIQAVGTRARNEPNAVGSFVMDWNRDIFMFAHRGTGVMGHAQAFYHSSYLSGKPVLAAGQMTIVQGVVKFVNLQSGHYKPDANKMLNVLEALLMHGVKLDGVRVTTTYPGPLKNGQATWVDRTFKARDFLTKRGRMALTDEVAMGHM